MEDFKSIRKHHRPLAAYSRRETIKWWTELIAAERYPLYCIFLTTPLEVETARLYGDDRKIFSEALDAMTGPFIALLALVENEANLEEKDYSVPSHPVYAYRFADAFGIKYDEFPSLVFFNDIQSSSYVVISLKGTSPEMLIGELQSIFATMSNAAKEGENLLQVARKYKQAKVFRKLQGAVVSGLEVSGKATIDATVKALINTLLKS
jgi:hypothetical protein